MASQNSWHGSQENNDANRANIHPFHRQQGPPVLPPPAGLETGQHFYSLPSLPSLGTGAGHSQQTHGFTIPSINTNQSTVHQQDANQNNQQQGPNQPNQSQGQPNSRKSSAGPQMGPPQPPNSSLSAYRPLNVKDALSYLDQVKIQFQNQAEVYNNFLDIMKDFKSQSIDTPGVIDRVSTLFRGHPNLIQGFNTFLPPGYRIECSLDPSDPNPIRVTTPMGTTTRPDTGANSMSYEQRWPSHNSHQQTMNQNEPNFGNQYQPHMDQNQNVAQLQTMSQLQAAATNGPSNQLQMDQNRGKGGHIEFNHAISYVNKIKTRFANQPDIYKHFLEILQTYQREQKPIGEVYQQVTILFQNAPDLLDDFKQFLPDTNGQALNQNGAVPPNNEFYAHPQGQPQAQGQAAMQLPPVGNFPPPTAAPGTIPLPQQQLQQPQPQSVNHFNQPGKEHRKKKNSISSVQTLEPSFSNEIQVSNVRTSVQPSGKKIKKTEPSSPTLIPGIPEPVPPISKQSTLSEEISFFDKVKKAIGNKQTYNEFLKMINLYSQDIIDKDTLVQRVEGFIGSQKDLFDWFKMFVGYTGEPQHIENIVFKKHQLELSLCKSYGPSYRQLPKAETYMPCSGRDEMCWEVLNDEWVGHPTWASEDSGFIAHRKNQYEEILFRIEEERHEYDFYMESNLRTIQTLETIANRIANMSSEEKATFKLPPGLGHTSVTIYKKVIRKVYDKDRGFEVIDALHENPAVAVPIVLKRLKQKDEEWKRSHREWNKVWREMEQRSFYKSLDHIGLTFKQADKKLLTAKQLVSEISTVKVEQAKRLSPLSPKPQEQLRYEFRDYEILEDILRLVTVFVRHSSNYSANDRERLVSFLKPFLTVFFSLPEEFGSAALSEVDGATDEKSEPESLTKQENGVTKKRSRESDLLRDVLKKSSAKVKKDGIEEGSLSPAHETSLESDVPEEVEKAGEIWVQTSKIPLESDVSLPAKRTTYNFFCNTTIYVFFRHLQALYYRLKEIKDMSSTVREEIQGRKEVQFAKDLDLICHQLEDMGINITGDEDPYHQVLKLSEKLIQNDIENQWFEESLRQGFRNKAYKLFTVDKVVQSIVKHMHQIITDTRNSDMMVLYETDRSSPITSAKDQIIYRMQVRALMGVEENMFKIAYNEFSKEVTVEYIARNDLTINDHKSAEEKYNYYVTSYIMSHPTEGVPTDQIRNQILSSSIDEDEDENLEGFTNSELVVKICKNTYRIFFEEGNDEYTRNSVYTTSKKPKRDKSKVFQELYESENGWKGVVEDADVSNLEDRYKSLIENGEEAYSHWVPVKELGSESDSNESKETATGGTKEKKSLQSVLQEKLDTNVDADQTIPQDDTIDIDAKNDNDTTADETVNQDDLSLNNENTVETHPSVALNGNGNFERSSKEKDSESKMNFT